jgi:hypothetical protein
MLEKKISYLLEGPMGIRTHVSLVHYENYSEVVVIFWAKESKSNNTFMQERRWTFVGECHVKDALDKFTGQIHKHLRGSNVIHYSITC